MGESREGKADFDLPALDSLDVRAVARVVTVHHNDGAVSAAVQPRLRGTQACWFGLVSLLGRPHFLALASLELHRHQREASKIRQ